MLTVCSNNRVRLRTEQNVNGMNQNRQRKRLASTQPPKSALVVN